MQDNIQQPDWNTFQQQNNAIDPYNEPTVQFTPTSDPAAPMYPPPPTTPFAQVPDAATYPYGQAGSYQGAVPPAMQGGGTAVPQKKRPDINRILLGVAGVVILLALVIMGIVFAVNGSHNQTASATPAAASTSAPATGSTPAAVAPANKNVYTPYLTQYRASVRNKVAQGLHLSAEQLGAQLAAGQTLSRIATAQGVSATQFQTIVTNAFQTAFQPAIDNNGLTTVQVNTLIKRMLKQPQVLDRYLVLRARKAVGKTPVGTPAQ